MSQNEQPIAQPPQPDEQTRRIHFYGYQGMGLCVLFLIPILALLGVFGETSTTLYAAEGDLELTVQYSNRILFQGLDGTEIAIHNNGDQRLERVTLSIDKAYLDAYSDISFSPDVTRITGDAYIIELLNVQPGQTQVVTMDSRGKLVGSHQGMIDVTAGAQSVSLMLDVFIIP